VIDYIHFFYGKNVNFDEESTLNSLNVKVIDIKSEYLLEQIKSSIKNKKISIVTISQKEESINEIFDNLKFIINQIHSKKVIYLTPERHFLTENEVQTSLYNYSIIETEESPFLQFSAFEKILILKIKELLSDYKQYLKSASVTTPISLFKELFTIKGNGTFFKLGSEIKKVEFWDVDPLKLKYLLETSFHRPIKSEFLLSKMDFILLESNYRGAAILKNTEYGTLLSKFAVDEIARGEGIGREIWDRMKKEVDVLFWRANKLNPINKWYLKECEVMLKTERWNIYWMGLNPNKIPSMINYVANLPEDFL
jgi:acetylglutamate kinase